MKVTAFPIRSTGWFNPDTRSTDHPLYRLTPKLVPPYVWTRTSTRVHRVRWVTIFPNDGGRWSIHYWCGGGSHTPRAAVGSDPPADREVCGTCHGRAIGAGQIDPEGTPLIFAPRPDTNLGTCVYLVGTRSPYYSGYSECGRVAVQPIPEVPGVGVCGQHARAWPPMHRWRYRDNLDHARKRAGC